MDNTFQIKILAEKNTATRTILGAPKYKLGDKVIFQATKDEQWEGIIKVVDAYGTLEQDEEPSYDIWVDGKYFCKHIKESDVIGKSTN